MKYCAYCDRKRSDSKFPYNSNQCEDCLVKYNYGVEPEIDGSFKLLLFVVIVIAVIIAIKLLVNV